MIQVAHTQPENPLNLSARELDVMTRIVTGATDKEIGRDLGISHRTVEKYVERASEKMGGLNRVQMAVAFVRGGFA